MKKVLGMTLVSAALLMACAGNQTTAKVEESTQAVSSEEVTQTSTEETTTEAASADTQTKTDFIVGFDQDFPPMGFVGEDGEFTGFDLELAKEAADRMGMEIKYQPIAWDSKDMELNSGNIDVIWNGFTIEGREDKYLWTDAYMDNSQIFVVAKDSGITSFADLAGKVVEVQADSSAEVALAAMPDLTSTFAGLQTTADYNTAFMDLEMGAVDAVAMDIIVAGYQLEKRDDDKYIIVEEPISSEKYGVGLKLGNTELRDKLQATLEEMAADGTMAEISEKWFGTDVTTIGK